MSRIAVPQGFAARDLLEIKGEAAAEGPIAVSLERAPGEAELRLSLEPAEGRAMLVARSRAGVLFSPVRLSLPTLTGRIDLRFVVEHGALAIEAGGREIHRGRPAFDLASIRHVLIEGLDGPSLLHRASPVHALDWRAAARPSGLHSRTDPHARGVELLPGVSFIVRARNESLNIEGCIDSVVDIAEEVIFVDNGSTDDTLAKVRALADKHSNVKVFSYPVRVPRVGRDHAEAVLARSSNTLGEYYNWCLSKATRLNFTKWDADFLCLEDNLREMYAAHDLATRGDNICLYYSGLEVYTDGQRWWIDLGTMQHEYRLFSKRHGCAWVDIPPWEEIDQSYLFKARKEYFLKPIYLEVFHIDLTEFERRGAYLRDARDRARHTNLAHYRDHGTLPAHFREVSGPSDPVFSRIELTSAQQRMLERARRIWGSIPMTVQGSETLVWRDHVLRQATALVLIMSCATNADKMNKIRASWAKDLERVGITYHFVVGRPGQHARIEGDILYVPAPDNYEGLPLKTLEMLRYFVRTGFGHMIKVDDDVILDTGQFWASGFWRHDYIGGVVAGQWGIMADWHFGKCENPALNAKPYWGEFRGPWYAGGAGYAISRDWASAAIAAPGVFEAELYEDKAVGDALRATGLLTGDLEEVLLVATAASIEAGDADAEPVLLAYDIARSADYAAVRDALKARRRPRPVPRALTVSDDAGPLSVTTDWSLRADVFQHELSDEDAA